MVVWTNGRSCLYEQMVGHGCINIGRSWLYEQMVGHGSHALYGEVNVCEVGEVCQHMNNQFRIWIIGPNSAVYPQEIWYSQYKNSCNC